MHIGKYMGDAKNWDFIEVFRNMVMVKVFVPKVFRTNMGLKDYSTKLNVPVLINIQCLLHIEY